MARKLVDIAVIIPDASPVLTLARIGRLDLLQRFDVPIHIVDQVHYEITKPENDPGGGIKSTIERMHNQVQIIETVVGAGFKALRERNPDLSSRNLGELAVSEYAMNLRKSNGPGFIPLVLYEDPDVEHLPVAQLKDCHLMNKKIKSSWRRKLTQ